MAKFGTIVISILLFGLFAAALITGGIRLAQVNGIDHSIGDDPSISSYASQLNQSLVTAYTDSNSTLEAVSNSPVTNTLFGSFIDAIGRVWQTMISVPRTIYNLTLGLVFQKLFGDQSFAIVTSIIAAIIVIVIILTVNKMRTSGDGI